MKEFTHNRLFSENVLYVCFAVAIAFLQLLPLSKGVISRPVPEFFMALTFAWVLYYPSRASVFIIAACNLFLDFCLMRPPGLWSALVLLACELLRVQRRRFTSLNFVGGAMIVLGAMGFVIFADRSILTLLLIPVPSLDYTLRLLVVSIGVYPFAFLTVCFAFAQENIYGESI